MKDLHAEKPHDNDKRNSLISGNGNIFHALGLKSYH